MKGRHRTENLDRDVLERMFSLATDALMILPDILEEQVTSEATKLLEVQGVVYTALGQLYGWFEQLEEKERRNALGIS